MFGFALMKMPRLLNAAYERSPMVRRNRDEVQRLRDAFKHVHPAAYRGVERCPLSEAPEPDPGWVEATPPSTLVKHDEEARRRLLEILGTDHTCDHYPCSVVQSLAQAEELIRLTDHPEEYEVVRLSREALSGGRLLGFDVGYWGGGNYSILCDAVIWPVWHPPVPAAFHDLSHRIASLNSHMLFPDQASAETFRAFYRTQSWAEIEAEPGEFSVIRIEAVE